jgi:hypothetical protein
MVSVASGGTRRYAVRLEPYTRIGATVIFLNRRLEIFGVSDRPETS